VSATSSGSPAASAAPDGDQAREAGADAARSGPLAKSAAGELWSGFGPDRSPSLTTGDVPAPAAGPGGQLAVGAGLLGLATLGLVGGLAVVAVGRRRRASARG